MLDSFPGVPLLLVSSSSVYAQTDGGVVTEESPTQPDRETGKLLLQAEQQVLVAGGIVARLAGIYGPGRSVILKRFLNGEAVIEDDGRRFLNQIHRDDAAAAEADAELDHCDDLSPLADALPAHRYPAGMARVIRARFALWIRAVLRADAGDCGMVACPVCGFVGDGSHERGDPCGLCWQRQICPIPRMTWGSTRPLWESAPKTRARAR